MNLEKSEAWKVLKEEEKSAIMLQLGYQKSTWEVGEILGKAHYKYLEISQRGQVFLKAFHEWFECNGDDFFPDEWEGSIEFRDYLYKTMIERQKVTRTITMLPHHALRISTQRKKLIIKELENLESSENLFHQKFAELIKEFDRYNNFRILPPEIQEPSGFKRRNKNRFKKQIKAYFSYSEVTLDYILENAPTRASKKGYAVVHYKGAPRTILVNLQNQSQIENLTKLFIYVFRDEETAQELYEASARYFFKNGKSCVDGQNFWPLYRITIEKAINYEPIQNITLIRKHVKHVSSVRDRMKVRKIKGPNNKG